MAAPIARGRMVRRSISESDKIASLSPEAAVLFMMLIPHFNAHGKMPGGPGVVKDEIVPLIPYFSYENLPQYLQEISDKTNVKWFRSGTRRWLHSLHFNSKHQDLNEKRMGADELPSWPGAEKNLKEAEVPNITELQERSGSSPGVVRDIPSRAEGFKVEGFKEEERTRPPTAVGGGSGKPPRATLPPPDPPESDEGIEAEVRRIKALHLATCGLATVPPLAVVREILQRGIPPARIDDVYQVCGGDLLRYRQRNIVERLTALRDGRERDPPVGKKGKLSASELRQRATFEACREFVGGDGDGDG
jgi:hypothetical protein